WERVRINQIKCITESSDSSSVSDKMLDVGFLDINRGLIINSREIFFLDLSAYDLESQPEISPLESRIKKFSDVITNSTNSPLTDELPANDVYIEIQYSKFCLDIPKRIIKPTEKFIEDAKKALQHRDPYHKLMDLFQIYGSSQEINLKWKNKDFPKEDLNKILDQWEKYISSYNFDSSFFTSINGDLNELYTLYEIFDQPLRQEIEFVIGVSNQSNIKERVLVAGAFPISDPPFSEQIFIDLIVIWILVGIPANVGFFSTDTRKIDIVGLGNTSLTVTSKSNNYSILLKVPENVPQSSILVTSFKFPPTNYDLNFKIEAQNNTANEIKITVCKLGSDKVDSIYELECSIQWCIIVIPENLKFYNSSISVDYLKAIGEYIYPEYNIMAPIDESKLNANQKFESDTQVGKFKDK
ncbi:4783_t:CDS:2, partial [Gigaspora rosea]